jgi:hypothetical protein
LCDELFSQTPAAAPSTYKYDDESESESDGEEATGEVEVKKVHETALPTVTAKKTKKSAFDKLYNASSSEEEDEEEGGLLDYM